MKQPKISNLKISKAQTKKIREKAASKQSVKITINIDGSTLEKLRSLSDKSGVPYQRLLNKILVESLDKQDTATDRLDYLEAEIKKIKRKLAA